MPYSLGQPPPAHTERRGSTGTHVAKTISKSVSQTLGDLSEFGLWSDRWSATDRKLLWVLATVSAVASGFHGYRRNRSIGWGLAWFVLGGAFPIVTPTIAIAQGFGKPRTA